MARIGVGTQSEAAHVDDQTTSRLDQLYDPISEEVEQCIIDQSRERQQGAIR